MGPGLSGVFGIDMAVLGDFSGVDVGVFRVEDGNLDGVFFGEVGTPFVLGRFS